MRRSDSEYYFEDAYCGGCGVQCVSTDRGLPCAVAKWLFPTCGDEDYDDGDTFYTYGDEFTLATNYADGRTVFSGDADEFTLATNYTDGRTVFSGDADDVDSLLDESLTPVMTSTSRRSMGSTRHSITRKDGVGDKITKRLRFFSGDANDVLTLSSQLNLASRKSPVSAKYSSINRNGAGDRITKRLQRIDERNKSLDMEPMTTGLSCLPATTADQDDASTVLFTRIAPLPTVKEEGETTPTASMMNSGEASAASMSGSGTTIPRSNTTTFSSRSAKSSKSIKTEKTSSSVKSFPGALMVAKASTKLRSAKPRLGGQKQQKVATGIIGANEKCVEVIDLDRRDDDRADERDQSTAKISNLARGQKDERELFVDSGEESTNSENGAMTTVKTAAGAMGSALTVLNLKKIKARHDTVKRVNAIEAEARKYSDRGKWNIAEQMYEESLRIKKGVLPNGHPEIIKTLDLLAMARIEQSDYTGAIAPVEEALESRRKTKGRDDLSVVNQIHSLAFLYRLSGDTAKLAEVNKEIGKVCTVPAM